MLEADSVALAFGGKDILSGCYICCKPGEVVGLLGRNGCGKSSLLKVIFGTLNPQFKHITLEGKIILHSYLKGKIAYLPQDNFMPRFLRVKDVLSECNHSLITSEISRKYLELLKMRLTDVSGGERRFLECLWVLSRPADYILLDEPFSEIAPYQIEVLQDIIREIGKTKGIILTDHMYQPLLDVSDRIVLLHNHAAYNIKEKDDLVLYQYIPDC